MGHRRNSKSSIAVVICVAAAMLAVWLPSTAAARGAPAVAPYGGGSHTYVVKPNGVDDTANIQAALNKCTSNTPQCIVQLVKGTYYISQLTVYGFRGSFLGAGQGATILQGLPNLPAPNAAYDTPTVPFWAGLPGPTNPWPVLLTFVNGAFAVTGMTVTDTYANPTVGWTYLSGGTFTWLWAGVLVTGTQAIASFDHITVVGGAGDLITGVGNPSTFDISNGINIEGMLLPTGWTDPFADQIPLSGSFDVTNSVSDYSADAVWVENLASASVLVCFNSIDSSPEPGIADVSNSQILFCGNRVTNVPDFTGFGVAQSYLKSNLQPSTVYVVGNYFGVNWYGSGPSAFDYGPLFWGLPSTLNLVVTGNVIVTDTSCGCYSLGTSDVFISVALASAVFSGNYLVGGGGGITVNNYYGGLNTGPVTVVGNTVIGADVGIWINDVNGAQIAKNLVKNSLSYGIVVVGGSSNTMVIRNGVSGSGLYDLYWDGTGTGNVWTGNVCTTSSPPGLC